MFPHWYRYQDTEEEEDIDGESELDSIMEIIKVRNNWVVLYLSVQSKVGSFQQNPSICYDFSWLSFSCNSLEKMVKISLLFQQQAPPPPFSGFSTSNSNYETEFKYTNGIQ